VLKSVMSSILTAGQEEAVNRGWGQPKVQPAISPIISIHGDQREAMAGLIESNKVELFIPRTKSQSGFIQRAPIMRIHALGEPEIVAALQDQLPKRVLGIHAMRGTDQRFEGSTEAVRPLIVTANNNLHQMFNVAA